MEIPKDKLGREINVGDYIVYAQRAMSSLWLDIGRVVSVGSKTHYASEIPFIKVFGCREYWDKPRLKNKPGEITCFNRVVVVPKEFVPEKYLQLLENKA
jgi:hypothetical protein